MLNKSLKLSIKNSKAKKFFALAVLFSFLFYFSFVLSQENPVEERQALEEELKKLEEQITRYEQDISKAEKEKTTLNNQINLLKKKIAKLNLQISQNNIIIRDLGLQIKDTESSIEQTSLKINDSSRELSNVLQSIYEQDQKSVIEILLSEREMSDFFDDLVSLEKLNNKSQELLRGIKELKVSLESQKNKLEQEKAETESVVKLQTLQKQESEANKKETDSLLKLSEKEYQESLQKKKEVEQKAAEIRARIFELIGVPAAPTFGEALEIAKYVQNLTGVRPAFLLAVLTQESNIGKNVGQCYLKNPSTGSGVVVYNNKSISKVMSPTRDVPPFLQITSSFGRDPYSTPVSCPMSYGWGGAMGPAQFIPSTWMLYRDKLRSLTGKEPDPWAIKDSFLASALYLSDAGASKGDYNSEWKAALIYFSGSTNKKYRFYGDSVMSIAAQYEKDIQAIEK